MFGTKVFMVYKDTHRKTGNTLVGPIFKYIHCRLELHCTAGNTNYTRPTLSISLSNKLQYRLLSTGLTLTLLLLLLLVLLLLVLLLPMILLMNLLLLMLLILLLLP